jgi:ATP-dependent RNA helicase RhlE
VVLYGGVGPTRQLEALKDGCDMIISSPGRLMELYLKGGLSTKKLKHVVLDEADRMMDMGFYRQIRAIQEVLPTKRQNLLFSATFPEKVDRLSDEFLLFPNRIEITPQATPVETVEQQIYRLPNFPSKLNLLQDLLEDREEFKKVIIFTRTKEAAVNIGKFLERKDLGPVEMIHSNRAQNARLNAINRFRTDEVRILVTTDVSARGIDIPKVSHVINFSIPRDHHDYVHRIGRTGRAFQTGVAISFSDPSEKWHVKKIEKLMGQAIPLLDPPEDLEMPKTSKEERQEQAREIDRQKKRDNPDFKGAFHEKKRKGGGRSGSTRNKFKSRSKKK